MTSVVFGIMLLFTTAELQLSSVVPLDSTVQKTLPVFVTPSLRHGIDTTISPCTDFDRFVNGGWRNDVVLPDSVKALHSFRATFHQTERRIVQILDSLRMMTTEIAEADARVVSAYYTACVQADSIPRVFQKLSMVLALPYDTARSSRCMRLAMHHLPDALGQLFVRSTLTPSVEASVTRVFEAIRKELIARVQGLPFVPDDAKQRTLDALQYLTFKLAKPNDTVDYRSLVLSPTDFPSTLRTIQEFTMKHRLVNSNNAGNVAWKDNQYNPNAHFDSRSNSIEIPTFLFQWPFFDDGRTENILSYAAAGVVVGHEVIHAITHKLSSEGEASVYKHSQRLIDHYSALPAFDGVRLDGLKTLNENLADLGGVLAAYDAWVNTDRANAAPLIDGFTPEQRFFLHYARLWRMKTTPEALHAQVSQDAHSPGYARINGVVMNVPAFAQAFGCKEGDPMAKSANERAVIW